MPAPRSPSPSRMTDSTATPLDELAGLVGQEPDTSLTRVTEGWRVVRPQTISIIKRQRLSGVGVDAGVRYPAIEISTGLRGNVSAAANAAMRAYRLNPQSAIGAVQSAHSSNQAGLMLGSRICIDSEVPWHTTGRHLVRLAVTEAGTHLFTDPRIGSAPLDRAGLGVWRNGLQGIASVEANGWRVRRRAADVLWAEPLGWPAVRGATVRLAVMANSPRIGRGLDYGLQMPQQYAHKDELAGICDALNEQEWQNATGAPHIGAWSATDDGRCRYQASIPARLGRRMPDLPRQLLATSGARANAALDMQMRM